MSDQEDLTEIEISIAHANELIAKKEAMDRLIANPDFALIITNGYFEKEASQLVMSKGEPASQGTEPQERIMKQIDAIGMFRQYLRGVIYLGEAALKEKLADEAEVDLIRKEE